MNSNFWQSSNYGSPSENTHEAAENVSSFSNNMRSLELNYDTSSMLDIQAGQQAARDRLQSNPGLVQTVSPSSTEVHYRMASTSHTPNDALFHPSANAAPAFNTSTPLPGFALTSTLPTLSSFTLLNNPTLYAPNNDASYHVAHSTSSHQTYPTTTNCTQLFSSQSPFEHRNRLGLSSPLHSGMPPPLRTVLFPTSPTLLPMSGRHDTSPTSYHNRPLQSNVNPFQLTSSPSPPLSYISRGAGTIADRTSSSGSSSYGYGPGTLHLDIPPPGMSGKEAPPFEATKTCCQLIDEARHPVSAEIQAKIDKGFFRADTDWCCYRRNYFSVACSYNLTGPRGEADYQNVHLIHKEQRETIYGFYVCIAAQVDGENSRSIELVQHTAKRDKGPMKQPERKLLKPNPSGNLSLFPMSSTFDSPHHPVGGDYHEHYQLSNPQDNPSVANFDRIQFKKATANNGKRRAAQQYFHIVVELYAQIRKSNGTEDYIKVAYRLSDPMVVRGRSPGHYADGTRTSSNMGGGPGAGNGYGTAPGGMALDSSMGSGHYPIRNGAFSTYHSHSHVATAPYNNLSSLPTGLNSIFYQQPMDNLSVSDNSTQSQSAGHHRIKYSPDHDSHS